MQRSHPNRSRNILFIGMPGVGKTTLGKVYAFRTGREFIDFDSVLEKQSGKTIREIFATEGEAGFRAREQRLLQRLAHKRGAVLSMGGGTLCNPANMRFARTLGLIVQLQASVETLAKRVFSEKQKRPLFSSLESEQAVQQKVSELLSIRSEFYNCCDVEINIDHSSLDCLVLELMQIEKRAHSVLQNRAIPKILMSDIGKSSTKPQHFQAQQESETTLEARAESSSELDSEPAPATKTFTLSLLPSLETPTLSEAKERTACETYDDLIWKDSLQENLPPKREKRENAEQPSLRASDEMISSNKKKRRKKKKRPDENSTQPSIESESQPSLAAVSQPTAAAQPTVNQTFSLQAPSVQNKKTEGLTLKPQGENRRERPHHTATHNSGKSPNRHSNNSRPQHRTGARESHNG